MDRNSLRSLAGSPAASLALALVLSACGGQRPADNGTPDSGNIAGQPCQFDTDCRPPDFVCGATGVCEAGCTANSCPSGKVCNSSTGRCNGSTTTDGGPGDGGANDGGATDGGAASATLCKTCTVNGDCAGASDLCLSNAAHTARFCAQDCTTSACPAGYQCTTNSSGSIHQCLPTDHACPNTGTDGGTTGGNDGGPTNDPTVPSSNPNGCKTCGQCLVNNDCVSGAFCVNGTCAAPCQKYFPDCILAGVLLSTCADVGLPNGQKVCVPLLGQCVPLPGPLAPLSGDVSCVPTGTNPSCTAPNIPAPALGANKAVTQTFSPKPLLATEDSIARDSKGNLAIGFIGVDGSGNSYMGVAQSVSDGASWLDKGKMRTANAGSVQSDPVLTVSKWTDPAGTHERMHYVWVSYKLTTSGGSTSVKDMFMESSYSDDGGGTWSNATLVTTTADNASGTLLLDKPWIAAAPDGTLAYTFSVGDNSQQHMYASVSVDHGQSWGPKKVIYGTAESANNNYGHNLGMPVFDPSDATGKTVYAVYVKYTATEATTSNSIQLTKSIDRGLTFTDLGPVSASTDQVLFEAPSLAMDTNKHLYVGYTASPQGTDAKYWDAMVATVDVSAATPVVAHRVRASDDKASCFQHFHAMVQVDPASGKVFVAWLDNRNNGKGGTYYAVSTDQGATFSANKRISDSDYTFNPDHQNAQLNFLGDYFGFLFDGTKLRVAWSDPRNGNDAQVIYAGAAP